MPPSKAKLKIVNRPPTSNFLQLIAENCPHPDKETLTENIKSLIEGMGSSLGAVVIEHDYICKDYLNLFASHLSMRHPKQGERNTIRLHFFTQMLTESNLWDKKTLQQHYIGYSVIRPLSIGAIGRTILDPHKLHLEHTKKGYLLRTKFTVHLNAIKLEVKGFPYAEQDSDRLWCGQTALWAVTRYLSERYKHYPEKYPADIHPLTESPEHHNPALSYSLFLRFFNSIGCPPDIITNIKISYESKTPTIEPESFENIYAYMESGFPILAAYDDHVVIIIGHTINYLPSRPIAPDEDGFIPACNFLDSFIINDSHYFPYHQLKHNTTDDLNPTHRYIESIQTATCPLPRGMTMTVNSARQSFKIYYEAVFNPSPKKIKIRRIFATTGTALKRIRFENLFANPTTPDPWAKTIADLDLPAFVWVMEVGTEEEYRHGNCSIEMVLDATSGQQSESLIYARQNDRFWSSQPTFSKKADKKGIALFHADVQTPQMIEIKQFSHNLANNH